jgi:protocadherin Fat 1/2/3
VTDEELAKSWESAFENGTWETFDAAAITGKPIFRMVAFDLDDGDNGRIAYSIKTGRGHAKFQMDPNDGTIYATSTLKAGESYDLLVKATDKAAKSLSTLARIALSVDPIPALTDDEQPNRAPTILEKLTRVSVLESDPIGHLVTVIAADDKVI